VIVSFVQEVSKINPTEMTTKTRKRVVCIVGHCCLFQIKKMDTSIFNVLK
jgi:hypothetical protein